jgi:hypothetical protein
MRMVWYFILRMFGIRKKKDEKRKDASIYPMF